MRVLVLYDISDDRARQRVADACLDYGLERVQFSVFVGELSRTHQRALFGEIRERVGRKAGHVVVLGVPEDVWDGRRVLDRREAMRVGAGADSEREVGDG